MSIVSLDLAGAFPRDVSRILELGSQDSSFIELAEAYSEVSAELEDIASGIDPVCEAYHAQLMRQQNELKARLQNLLNS